jgi:hypothetical protein
LHGGLILAQANIKATVMKPRKQERNVTRILQDILFFISEYNKDHANIIL